MNKNNKKKSNSWMFLVIIFVILLATKPDSQDFKEHLTEEMTTGNIVEDLFLESFVNLAVETLSEEDDYIIFTVTTFTDFDGTTHKYFGIAGTFIEIG